MGGEAEGPSEGQCPLHLAMEDDEESERREVSASGSCQDSTDKPAPCPLAKTLLKSGILTAFLLLLLLVHVSVGLRLQRVPHPDEYWTISKLMASSGQLVLGTILKHDNHPPLYYLLSKGWIALTGATIPQLRWLSFLFTSLTLFFVAWVYRRHPRFEMAVVLVLLGTNPLLTYFSATVRPYSLVVLLATVMTWSALQLRRGQAVVAGPPAAVAGRYAGPDSSGRRVWACLYYGSALLLGLTHYFGTLYVLMAICLDFLGRRIERSPWKGMLLILLICAWPLLQILTGTLDQQAEANSWVNVFPLISTVNNFLAGVFPLLMISRMPQLGFGVVLALVLLLLALKPFLKSAGFRPIGRRAWLGSLLGSDAAYLVALNAAVVAAGCVADALLPFTTPYYFLVCLPAVTILLGQLLTVSWRDRFSGGLCLFLTLVIVALQIQMAHQRLSMP